MDIGDLNTYFDMEVSELEVITFYLNGLGSDRIFVTHGRQDHAVTRLVNVITGGFQIHCVINGKDTYIPCHGMTEALSKMHKVKL